MTSNGHQNGALRTTTRGPLAGLRILDLGQVAAAPYGAMLLADLGAEVIKVESPQGDAYRHEGPSVPDGAGGEHRTYYLRFNRNKQSIVLDLKHPDGKRIFRELAAVSDVVWENFRPGVMERLGLGYEELRALNPGLMYVSISGFGHPEILESPYADRPAFAIIAEAMGGLMETNGVPGGPPMWLGFGLADLYAGLMAAFGLVAALRERDQTGVGRQVDISLYDTMLSANERAIFEHTLTGRIPSRGNEAYLSSWGAFPCKDGYVAMATVGGAQWERLCTVIGRRDFLDDPEFATAPGRGKKMASVIRPAIEAWLADRGKAEATELLAAAGIPTGPVQNAKEIVNDPHVQARQMLVEFEHPLAGMVQVVANPVKLEGLEAAGPTSPPLLGEQTRLVLSEVLHLDEATVDQLIANGATGKPSQQVALPTS